MKIKSLLIFLLLCSQVFGASQVVRYVDTGSAAGGDGTTAALSGGNHAYQTLNAGLAAEEKDISVGTGSDEQFTFYCDRTGGGGIDTTVAAITTTWVTAAANYVEIIGSDFPSDGIWDATKYFLHNDDSAGHAVLISTNYARLRNMQFQTTITSGTRHAILFDTLTSSNNEIWIDSCIIKGICSGAGGSVGISSASNNNNMKIFNCIVFGFQSGGDSGFVGMSLAGNTRYAYNCTVYGCGTGMQGNGIAWTNCISGNNNNDFTGDTIDYCCSDDGDGTNSNGPASGSWANEFNNAGSNDFSLLAGGNCISSGTDNPSTGDYLDDIIGATRASTWSRGAYEAGSSTGISGQMIIISGRFWEQFIQEGIKGKWRMAA